MLPHDAAGRKAMPILKFLTTYFPDAIEELTKLCVQGNVQHNPDRAPEDITWAREKSPDQLDAGFRHIWDHCTQGRMDTDGQRHLIKAAWRMLAEAQLNIEEERNNERERNKELAERRADAFAASQLHRYGRGYFADFLRNLGLS